MSVALTGATGFVGQAVMDEAARRGVAVRALTRREQAPRAGVSWVLGDLADQAALARLVEGAGTVLHIAGVVNAPDWARFYEGNVLGTQNVVHAATQAGSARFVCVSSLAAREPGLSQYGRSKREAEEHVRAGALDWSVVRPPAVYGPRDTEILELFRAALWHVVPMPPAGHASMIHVADLARLLLDLSPASPHTTQQTFEPDDGRPGGWGHADLARAIGKAVGRSVWAPHVPRNLLQAAARLDQLVRGPRAKLTLDRASYMAHPDWVSDPAHAVPSSLWQPQVATPEGLAETARWYRAQGWL